MLTKELIRKMVIGLAIILATAIVMYSNYDNEKTKKVENKKVEKGYKQCPDNKSRQQWAKEFRNAFK